MIEISVALYQQVTSFLLFCYSPTPEQMREIALFIYNFTKHILSYKNGLQILYWVPAIFWNTTCIP
jgi:hypothetical protein